MAQKQKKGSLREGGLKSQVPADWRLVLDATQISRCVSRISYEIVERNRDLGSLAIVGIRTGGEYLAQRLHKRINEIEGRDVPLGVIDITLYRDDLSQAGTQPKLKGTDLPFSIAGTTIILVDDVLFTGRTVRAALDGITDFGRPNCVQLATLVDRGHRELPIRPDYVGKNIPTSKEEFVSIRFSEGGFEDGVYVYKPER